MNANKLFAGFVSQVFLASWLAMAQDSRSQTYEHKTDVVYGEVHGTGLLMDVFTPKSKPNGLAIVDVVSGVWRSDRGKIRDHSMAQLFNICCSHGYTVFAVRPGSRTRYTGLEMVSHIKMGIRYVKQHAAEYSIDPERLGLTGASAGGHLALLTAIAPEEGKSDSSSPALRQSTKVKATAVFFPPTDFLDWDGQPADLAKFADLFFLGGSKGQTDEALQEQARKLSPARLVAGPTMPFLFIHGDTDPLVPLQQSQKMVEALRAAGGLAELVVKEGGGHPWFTIPEEVKLMAKWFDQKLADKPAGEKKAPTASP
jgi:acetyl esterase/lipase